MVDIGAEVRAPGKDVHSGGRDRSKAWLEVVGLLIAPIVVFFLLGEQGMTNTNIEDQHFYQAYAEHGDDLMLRLGDYRYYWVRLAFILPSRVSYDLFGAVHGFYVWRWVLALVAIVPAYLLLRRLHGVAAGWVAVATVLSSPVLIYAWGTDYPDSSAVSYLIAGTACLYMPVRGGESRRARVGWLVLSGLAFSLAVHSQFISGPLVAIAVLVYLLQHLRADWRSTLVAAGVLLACAAVVTAVLSVTAWVMWGRPDIIYPTIRAALHFRTPNELRKWHSPNWRWVLRTPYVLVPLLTPALWAVATRGTKRSRAELGLAMVLLAEMALFSYLQFFAVTSELEYHVYSSMLWSATALVMAVTVARLCGPLLARRRMSWLPVALVLAVPYALTATRDHVEFELAAGLVVCVALLAVLWFAVGLASRPPIAAGLVAVVVGATYLLTTAEPPRLPYLHQQRHFPEPDYAHALRNNGAWHAQEYEYELAAQLNKTMPKATKAGQTLLTWFSQGDALSSDLSAQYLWTPQSLTDELPVPTATDVAILVHRHVQTLVLLGPDPVAFQDAVTELSADGFPVAVSLRERLAAGNLSEQVWVLQLGAQSVT